MTDRVTYSFDDGVATIAMDDGKVHVMSTAMLHDLDAALGREGPGHRRAALSSQGYLLRRVRPQVFAANDAEGSLEMVRAGAELALRLLSYPLPTIGVMEGHAFPMGTFLLLACDVRIAAIGEFRMGLNEVAIGIAPPSFAIELARNRVHPAWLSRTVTLGEMFEPDDAVAAGFLDRAVAEEDLESTVKAVLPGLKALHGPSHATAKQRLRRSTVAAMREAIDTELTLYAYRSRAAGQTAVVLPGANRQVTAGDD